MSLAISREPADLVTGRASIAYARHRGEPSPRNEGRSEPCTQHTDDEHSNLSLTSSLIGRLLVISNRFIAITSQQGCRIVNRLFRPPACAVAVMSQTHAHPARASPLHRIAIEMHRFVAERSGPLWTALTFQLVSRICRGTSVFGLSINVPPMRVLGGWTSGHPGRPSGAVCSADIRACRVTA